MTELVLEGEVVRVTFENDETGYRVVRILPILVGAIRREKDTETVVGVMPRLGKGDRIRIAGVRVVDPKHGAQIKAAVVTHLVDEGPGALLRYLATGAIRGVRARMAQRIVDTFGAETLHILDHNPERLVEVSGISREKANKIAVAFREHRVRRELGIALAALEIAPGLVAKIERKFGLSSLAIVQKAPYRLALEVPGVGFKTADTIARKVGIAEDDPARGEAAVLHALSEFADAGHTVTPRATLSEAAARLLESSRSEWADAPDEAARLLAEYAVDRLTSAGLASVEHAGIGHASLVAAEQELAEKLRQLCSAPAKILVRSRAVEERLGDDQLQALSLAMRENVCVITGGPGVGKTTLVRALLEMLEASGMKVALAAPTGRAARRMTDATGRPARTLHRLLEVDPRSLSFTRNALRPLEFDALIVDETSMVDVPLARDLLAALRPSTRLLLVGDVDQLPSVGPGAFLRDVLESERVPVARLTKVYRQSGSSHIVDAAHGMLAGKVPQSSPADPGRKGKRPTGELFLIERADPHEAASTIVELVSRRIPEAFATPAEEIQVLVPMRKGGLGTEALNTLLQERINPNGVPLKVPALPLQISNAALVGSKSSSFLPLGLRVGDRVMQRSNDYEREVFNGDLGQVLRVELGEDDDRTAVVAFDGREVRYPTDALDALQLAYACTVHKAQGSEYPAVVLGLLQSHFTMLNRSLVYTAITRAKGLVVVVGQRSALQRAIQDLRVEPRRTTLLARLR